ncbi:NAD-dependent epimerase/dehydratase family protein [Nocardioides sp. URHA0020]|uniref:NAD-dependent epimerase/dehydratase family protein n=1 Tax=Nocardioides sp. URHA0020 TaxID=1380392 RepID=UPI000491661E|nr:NAD-dependent epimerase/dehydratase family protein [Nocardioides sp. URHA0020]
MKALVTGVAGFIGSTLAARLLQSDDVEVVGVDCFSDYYSPDIKRRNLSSLLTNSRFTFVEADLSTDPVEELVRDVNWIFHQAGQPGVRKSWGADFQIYVDANVSATQRLLEASRESSSLKAFVYASSSSVYGDAERYPTRESDRPTPLSPYGVTKLAAEHLCVLYAKNFGVPTTSLRYFTVYGPGQRPDMAFHRFVRAAISDESLTVFGTGEQVREFTHVSDIVAANILTARAELPGGTVINLSGGSAVSVNEVLDQIADIHGSPLRVERGNPVPGDVFRTGGSTELAQTLLGWSPVIGIREGLESEYHWMAKLLEG